MILLQFYHRIIAQRKILIMISTMKNQLPYLQCTSIHSSPDLTSQGSIISTCTLIDDAIIIKSEWLRKICPILEIQIEIYYDSLLESLL